MNADRLARQYRDKANRLTKKIEELRRDRLENTPKRQREGMSRRIDAAHLERVRTAFNRMAEAIEGPGVPQEFGFIGFKEIDKLYKTKLGHAGHYRVYDTGEYHDDSATAKAFREWIESDRPLADRIADTEQKERDLIARLESEVKFADIPGFFPTPAPLVERLLDEAQLTHGCTLLEPSAGKGDIADAARERGAEVTVIERSLKLCEILKAKAYHVAAADFLADFQPGPNGYDRVVMNPPFEKAADIDHVMHAFNFLRPGGRLVAVMSAGTKFRSDTKTCMFRDWLDALGGLIEDLPEDSFGEAFRATKTRTVLVVIDKDDPVTEADLTCPFCGTICRFVNECGCDPNNLPTTPEAPPGYLF
jgi:hypothetical protein